MNNGIIKLLYLQRDSDPSHWNGALEDIVAFANILCCVDEDEHNWHLFSLRITPKNYFERRWPEATGTKCTSQTPLPANGPGACNTSPECQMGEALQYITQYHGLISIWIPSLRVQQEAAKYDFGDM